MQTSLKTFSERLFYLIDKKGFNNPNEFGKYLGYASSEKISRLIRNPENKPSYDILVDITNKFEDVNSEWLLTGRGEMIRSKELIKEKKDEPEITYLKKRIEDLESTLKDKEEIIKSKDVIIEMLKSQTSHKAFPIKK